MASPAKTVSKNPAPKNTWPFCFMACSHTLFCLSSSNGTIDSSRIEGKKF